MGSDLSRGRFPEGEARTEGLNCIQVNQVGAALNIETALLAVRRMDEADRLAVATGAPAIVLMENARTAIQRTLAAVGPPGARR
jgi:hypothetical protein